MASPETTTVTVPSFRLEPPEVITPLPAEASQRRGARE